MSQDKNRIYWINTIKTIPSADINNGSKGLRYLACRRVGMSRRTQHPRSDCLSLLLLVFGILSTSFTVGLAELTGIKL